MDPQAPTTDSGQEAAQSLPAQKNIPWDIIGGALIFVVVIAGLLGTFSYLHIISFSSILGKKTPTTAKITPTPLPVQSVSLPLSPYLSILDDVTVRYNGKTTVANVTQLDGKAIVQFDNFQQPGLVFNVDEKTKVTKSSAVTKQVSVSEIKQRSQVSFSIAYSITHKTWTLTSLVLLNQ